MSNKMFFSPVGGAVSPYLANLVAYYPFNTNSNDFSGNVNNGTDTAISYANAGKVGNSATFNGTTSKVVIPQSTNFDFSNVTNDLPFTISFWFNTTNLSRNQWIFNKRVTTEQWEIFVAAVSLSVNMTMFTNAGTYLQFHNNTPLSNNTWYLATFTYDGSGLVTGCQAYINGVIGDGVSRSTIGLYTKMPIASQNTVVGVAGFVAAAYFGGKIDELAVWKNRVLTPTEVLDIYNKGIAGTPLI